MLLRRVALGSALLIGGLAGSWLIGSRDDAGSTIGPASLALAATLVIAVFGLLILGATLISRGRSRDLVRLDHFLPFLRKRKKSEAPLREPLALRIMRRLLPPSMLSDPARGKPGALRRALKRIGPTVVSAPVRRLSQTLCLILFLWLFFHVCWPYTAQPAPPGGKSSGWKLDSIAQDTGDVRLLGGERFPWALAPRSTVHLVDERAENEVRGDLGAFFVIRSQRNEVTLRPTKTLDDEQWETLLTSVGAWTLHERSPWPDHYADDLHRKEMIAAETFLAIDPLVSLSTAIASRSWVWSLLCAAIILTVCVLIPRGFCGYLCPLGTVIDLFDWSVSKRIQRFRVPDEGWWVHIKYYLLMSTLVCAAMGVLVSGYVAAIPVITRGMLFLGEPLQSGAFRGWGQVPPINAGHLVSLALFFAVLGLGFLKPRFWCKYVCPSGAVFSLGNLFRLTERKVESSCINCNKCVQICPFDAIKPDFTTRTTDCTLCQTCAGVCPTQAIKFVERWNVVELKVENDPPTGETSLGRRGFMSLAAGTTAAALGGITLATVTKAFGARLDDPDSPLPVRPPGSVPEQEFLQMCIRCGECFKACPYNVLQPLGFQQGLEGLWTPQVVADHAGCAPSCNACGQVCPTGAIRALPLNEKRFARMGLAIVDPHTCLPLAGREECQLCVDECIAAGYHAIEFTRVHTQADAEGIPIEGSGFLAPVVLSDKCVGCGLCQMACHRVNVKQNARLDESAIIVEAGPGKEDRISEGSYRALRQDEARRRREQQHDAASGTYFVPEEIAPVPKADDTDPFGLGL